MPEGQNPGECLDKSTSLPDFDTLRWLADHDPEQLKRLRVTLTEQLIAKAPPRTQPRLRGLQFEIDARVRLASNPIAACITVSAMMRNTLEELRQALNGRHVGPAAQPAARLLSFPAKPVSQTPPRAPTWH